jgi:tetrapyrrole methylase family protein / MazG family protein
VGGLTVVGLGPGGPELLTREAEQTLGGVDELYLRTRRHPTVESLGDAPAIRSFDDLYERAGSLDEVYRTIADRLVELARRPKGVVYAVPGHPLVGKRSVRLALERAAAAAIPTRVVAGLSFVEPTLALVGADPIADGLQIVDAAALVANHFGGGPRRDPFAGRSRLIDPTRPSLLTQVDSARLTAGLKLALLEWLPPNYEIALVRRAGLADGRAERRPLVRLDRAPVDHLTSLYLPPAEQLADLASFETLRYITTRLRADGGCPWDREQTHASLRPNLIEEAYEAVEAVDRGIESGDWSALTEELGDVMMNLLLHAQIAAEADQFWLEDVFRAINAKLVRRHPHVFGDVVVADADEVVRNWDRIKRHEKVGRADASRLGEVPASLPALARAQTLGRRARRAGFEWTDVDGAWAKLSEELAELRAAGTDQERHEELGDVLWMVTTLAGYLGIDAEESLRQGAQKFARRFRAMEQLAAGRGDDFAALGVARQLELWQRVKDAESA